MNSYKIKTTSSLAGSIMIPTSKSHTLRAILFATLAEGVSTVRYYLKSPDAHAMIQACRLLGAVIEVDDDVLTITGTGGRLQVPADVIDCGNSGQVLRFIGAIAGLIDGYTVLTGDESIRSRRPVVPLLEGLNQLGAVAESSCGNGKAPIIVRGKMSAGNITIDGEDSQPVSGMLIAAALLKGDTTITVNNAGEKPWVALTLSWFDFLGINYEHDNFEKYIVRGHNQLKAFDYTVPGDFSSLAFPVAAALLTDSEITIAPVDMNDAQGDKKILAALEKMGASFDYDHNNHKLTVKNGAKLQGCVIDINDFVDAITILAVVGCKAAGETQITGAAIARQKECNRLQAICTELKKMGADIRETEDGLIIRLSSLQGTQVASYHDHRMVMSLSVAALLAAGETEIDNVACVSKSFPGFAKTMQQLGMKIEECA